MRNKEYSALAPIYSLIPEGLEDLIQGVGNLNVDQVTKVHSVGQLDYFLNANTS